MTNIAIKRKAQQISKEDEIQWREDQAKRLFELLEDPFQTGHTPFVSQYLVVIEENKNNKSTTECDYRCLLNAKKILVVPRVVTRRLSCTASTASTADSTTGGSEVLVDVNVNHAPTYLYTAHHLHCKMHFSCSKATLEQLKHVCPDAMIVLCKEDMVIRNMHPLLDHIVIDTICSQDFHILRENLHPEESSFFQEIRNIMIIDLFPEVRTLLSQSIKSQKNIRKTAAIHVGYSTTDCNRYVDNRWTIFDNIKPFLSGLKLSENARRSLGKIALLVFKKSADKNFIQCVHNNPTDRDLAIRYQLRREFANYLYIDENDMPYFMAEGIAITLNPYLGPHKDKLNDPKSDITLTVTSMCQIIKTEEEDENDKRIQSKFERIVDGRMCPFTVIFYSRRVCASYDLLRNKLDAFGKCGKFREYLIQCILDINSPTNYYARLFDSNEYYEQISMTTEPIAMPKYHDPMSRYSIVLDCIFHHVVQVQNTTSMTVENLLVLLLNLVRHHRNSELYLIIENYKPTTSYTLKQTEIEKLFQMTKKMACSHSKNVYSEWIKLHGSLLDSPFHLNVIEATELIHLMSLIGIVPLEFCMWSPIRCLPPVVQEKEWSYIIHFVKRCVNQIATVDTLKSIAIDYQNQFIQPGSKHRFNCEEVFGNVRTWHISKTGKFQNIFRLKQHQASDLVALTIRAPIEDNRKCKRKSIHLTNWRNKESNICWVHPDDNNLALHSKMHIPPDRKSVV